MPVFNETKGFLVVGIHTVLNAIETGNRRAALLNAISLILIYIMFEIVIWLSDKLPKDPS